MAYYLDIFSPDTYENFLKSPQDVAGFPQRRFNTAAQIKPGDKLICYLTKMSRWIGILEVLGEVYKEETPLFVDQNDPYVVRLRIKPIVLLTNEETIPIHEEFIWTGLSFTKKHDPEGSDWTSIFRTSLTRLDEADGEFLEKVLLTQAVERKIYPIEERVNRRRPPQKERRPEIEVDITIPAIHTLDTDAILDEPILRESAKVQALVAEIGEKMGFKIWIPRNDRSRVLREWEPEAGKLIDNLPLSYDQVTMKTIEQIDVLWLRGRTIARAFEIEHTTSIYSGILRMADLLALQPNINIKLHIVAPANRRRKVFEELQRPVFSRLEGGPLTESCTYISYDSINDLAGQRHLGQLRDTVLEEYAESVE
jgi:predicted RNA-binding protein